MNKKSWFNKNILGFGLTSLFNDFSHEMATSILPSYIQEIFGNYAPYILGLIYGISDAVASIIKILSGILTDKLKNYKIFLIIGYILTPLFVSLIGFAKNFWQILTFKTIAWTGKGMREPMRDKWITQIEDPKNYGKAFGFVRSLDSVGAIVGPLCAYFLIKYFQLKTIFFIALIPGIFSVLALIFLTSQNSMQIINNKYINWRNQLKKLPTKFNYFVFIMFLFSISNFNKLLIVYRAQEILTGKATSSIIITGWTILLYSLFNVVRSLSEYFIGSASDYFNRKNLLAICGLGFFSITSILLIFNFKSLIVWILIFLFAGISTATVNTLDKVYSAILLPENVRGTGFGVLQMTFGIGSLISNIIVGTLWTFISTQISFIYSLIFSFLAMILLLRFK